MPTSGGTRDKAVAVLAALALLGVTPNGYDPSLIAPYGRPQNGGASWTAPQVAKLGRDIDRILENKTLRSAHIGLLVVSTQDGQRLYARNADQVFMPASNFKLLTGSAALQKLGTDFTFATSVSSDGTNLYLRGTGDALLSAADLDAAAAKVAASGITHVPGMIITDASALDSKRYADGWSWDDLPYYYAPAISALGIEDHIIHVYERPGGAVGEPAMLRIEPHTNAFKIDNHITTGGPNSKDTTDIVRNPDDWNTITLTGSYPLNAKESDDLVPAVPNPARYAGDVFLQSLRAHGVVVDGGIEAGVTPAGAHLVWAHQSAPLRQLLADFWWPSDNLIGELLFKRMGALASGKAGTAEAGATVEKSYLKAIGINPDGVEVSDGSGLSQYDRISPHDLVTILQSDWKSPNRDIVLDALPLAGVRGSLKTVYKNTPAEKNVFAKTGSMSKVRTISGYLRTQHHGTVTFSFMLDDWLEDTTALTKIRADLFSRIIAD
ncbi:MAG: hypothetical protein NVSMB31_02060 [Vulcanimicrobiaceae bacterium]